MKLGCELGSLTSEPTCLALMQHLTEGTGVAIKCSLFFFFFIDSGQNIESFQASVSLFIKWERLYCPYRVVLSGKIVHKALSTVLGKMFP